jgi:hypothetical protein
MKADKEDFKKSQPDKAGLLEPLRKADYMEGFKKEKPDVKLKALRWVIVRDIVVAYRFPIVFFLAAFGLTALEPAAAKQLLRVIVMQVVEQRATVPDAGAKARSVPEEQHADKSRHAPAN